MEISTIFKVAVTLRRFKMFPYFEIAHYILMCINVRESSKTQLTPTDNIAQQQINFSRSHPLASWSGSVIMCFAGTIIGNLLLGEPITAFFFNIKYVMAASTVWYLINYSPFDVVYRLCNFAPLRLFINVLKEIRRANRIHSGVAQIVKLLPGTVILPFVFGVLKGTASSHMRVAQRFICGTWDPATIELLHPSITTKASFVASFVFVFFYLNLVHLQFSLIYLIVAIFLLLIRALSYFKLDPFSPVENFTCCLFTGGVMDSLRRAADQVRGGDGTGLDKKMMVDEFGKQKSKKEE